MKRAENELIFFRIIITAMLAEGFFFYAFLEQQIIL